MFIQTLYFIVDLYFVSKLGSAARVGLSLTANIIFLILALSQILNVSIAALISNAGDATDQQDANLTFNQSMMLSTVLGIIVYIVSYISAKFHLNLILQDPETIIMGLAYLHWFITCMALQFIIVSLSAALLDSGIIKPTMVIQTRSILLNIILSPILIAGWGSGYAMSIADASFASSLSVVFAVVLLCYYFITTEKYVCVNFAL